MIGIYKITNKITHQVYIGQSIHIENRWKQHKNPYNWNRESTKPLYKDMLKYGIDNFDFQILEECAPQQLNNHEVFWIKYFNSYKNGYNQNQGGLGVVYNHQEIFDLWDAGYSNKEILELTGIKSPATVLKYLQGYKNYSVQESNKRGGCLAYKNNHQCDKNLVYQYDLNGNFIQSWFSRNQVQRILNIDACSVGKCIAGKANSAGGFQWTNYYAEKIQPIKKPPTGKKKVAQIDLKTNTIITIYDSIKEAAIATKADSSAISKVCKGIRNKAANYGWKYIGE